jgi:hypothetical protein
MRARLGENGVRRSPSCDSLLHSPSNLLSSGISRASAPRPVNLDSCTVDQARRRPIARAPKLNVPVTAMPAVPLTLAEGYRLAVNDASPLDIRDGSRARPGGAQFWRRPPRREHYQTSARRFPGGHVEQPYLVRPVDQLIRHLGPWNVGGSQASSRSR